MAQQREMERQLQHLRVQIAGAQSGDLLSAAFTAKDGFKVVVAAVEGADQKRLVEMSDALREKLGSGVVVLAGRDDGKVSLLAAVTRDLAAKVHAGKLIGQIAPIVGGRGGGRPEMAQAGGKDPSKIDDALEAARALFR
jgi:alanyl-tRNA synthetase